MKKVIFWHTYLVNDYKLVVQEQIIKLFTSGLYDQVDYIFVGISAKSMDDVNWFLDLVKKYKKFSPIIHNDTSSEKATMRLLNNYAKENDCYLMYFHTKAVSNVGYNNTLWRWSMDYNLMFKWKECVSYLEEGFDAVGSNLRTNTHVGYYPHFSGNAWWSKSDYVKKLDETYLCDIDELTEKNPSLANNDFCSPKKYPLLIEFFIGSNSDGKLKSIFECKDEAPYQVECLINEYVTER